MILLTFAHRPEAKAFLSHFKSLRSHPKHKNLYVSQDEKIALLITAEGILTSSNSLSFSLGLIPKVDLIINLGVAGSLNPDLRVGDIIIGKNSYLGKSAQKKRDGI